MHQLDLWSLLAHTNAQDEHRQLQQRLPTALAGWELLRIDYAPKGYRVIYWPLSIFTELQPTIDAAIQQAYAIGFLTETLPLPELERMFAAFGGVLPGRLRRTLQYLEQSYPTAARSHRPCPQHEHAAS